MNPEPHPFLLRHFAGPRPGLHLLITAGVHGDEYLPMLAVRELIRLFDSSPHLRENLRGSLTLIPVANEPAFRLGRRCGDDGLDLARTCPGRADGSITQQIAHSLSLLIQKADAYVDLHTGGSELSVLPLAGYVLHPDQNVRDRQRSLAQAFNLPFLWGTAADLPGRTLSVARDAGVPAIYVEYFGSTREREEIAAGAPHSPDPLHPCVAGCLHVLAHLGMVDHPAPPDLVVEIVEDHRPGSGHMQVCHPAPCTGFFRPLLPLGARVETGQPLGEVSPLSGGPPQTVPATHPGRLVVLRDHPRAKEGESVAVVAENFGPS